MFLLVLLTLSCISLGLDVPQLPALSLLNTDRTAPGYHYNHTLAQTHLAYAAAASCTDASLLTDWKCRICREGSAPIPPPPKLVSVAVIRDEKSISQAVVGVDLAAKRIVLAFQGTIKLEQVLEDIDVVPIPKYCSGCEVVQGFYDAFKRIEKDVARSVHSASSKYSIQEVHITGHSLGATMAVHAAIKLKQDRPSLTVVAYTFGQPRVGNKAFATWFRLRFPAFFRVVNFKDPVAALPPIVYHHIPTEVWYFEKPRPGHATGRYKVCSRTDGEDKDCQRKVCGFLNCLNGEWHNTYLNLKSVTDPALICEPDVTRTQ